jgi:flavin reductase (DIM6/NTAB) family NADH-FMN oxidoreductase RutF
VFGKNFPKGVNEIQEAGLGELKSTIVKPPGIVEYKAHIECRFKWEKDVGSHMLVAGEMLTGSCDEGLLDKKGYFDVVKAGILHIVRYPEPVYISPEKYVEGKR